VALALRDKIEVIPFHYDDLPGLEFVEESLAYYEKHLFGRRIPMCAFVRKRKFPEHDRLRDAPGRPTGFELIRNLKRATRSASDEAIQTSTCGAMDCFAHARNDG
jgi:hypothetical protein